MCRDVRRLSKPLVEIDDFGDLTIQPSLNAKIFEKVRREVVELEKEFDSIMSGVARPAPASASRTKRHR